MKDATVALVTCRQLGGLDVDDEPLRAALERRGLRVETPAWDDQNFDWSSVEAAVLRSTWDYFQRREAFLAWCERVSAATSLVNPLAVIRWNTHKGYLLDLAARGCPVVPTALLSAGRSADLPALLAARGWAAAVIKPAVSADSWETIRVDGSSATAGVDAGQRHLDRLLPTRDMLVQPYVASVDARGDHAHDGGERCLVVIEGRISHAVRKRSLWQGGRHTGPEGVAVAVTDDEAALAEQVLTAALASIARGAPPAAQASLGYARIDVVRDAGGSPMLAELELTEPTLFLRDASGAAEVLAAAVVARLR